MADAHLMGEPVPLEFEGHVYQVGQRTFRHEAHFQVWLEREAYLGIQRHRETLGDVALAEQLTGWRHDVAARVFSFDGEIAIKALFTEPGFREMAFLLMKSEEQRGSGSNGRPVTRELVDRICADPAKSKELVGLVLGTGDPNSKAPAGPEAAGR